jgi:hypothetical protein
MRKSVFPGFLLCVLNQDALFEKFKEELHYGHTETMNFICASVLYHCEYMALLDKVGIEHS